MTNRTDGSRPRASATASTDLVGELAVTEFGEGDRLVVFVHGVLDRGRSFDRVADRLGGECRMAWYDRRGYGAAADAPGAPVGVDQHVDDLIALLDGRRAVLAGHSFGGVHALGVAARAPELVDAVVCYETVTAWAPDWPDVAMQVVLTADDPEGAGLELMLGARLSTINPEELARRRSEAAAFVEEERSTRAEAPPYDLSTVEAPVVYGVGTADVIAPVLTFLASQIPRLEIVPIPGADHFAHRSAPDAFADLVRRGLAASDPSG